jgi:hypothetical protein
LAFLDHSPNPVGDRFDPLVSDDTRLPDRKGQSAKNERKQENRYPQWLIKPAAEVTIGHTHQASDLQNPVYGCANHQENDNDRTHGWTPPHH